MMDNSKPRTNLAATIGRPLLAGALAAGAAVTAQAASPDVFLFLDGIRGESLDNTYKDTIEVISYTQSFNNNAQITSGSGSSASKVTCGAITILKNVDRSSPEFIRLVTTGAHVAKGFIAFRSSGANPVEYYRVTLNDVIVTAVNQADSADTARIVERVSLLADSFVFEYTPVDAKGSTGTKARFGWDCVRNTKF